jgi:hypothetical protein
MKMYVQSASWKRDYHWVEVNRNTGLEVVSSSPHPQYEELLECLDPETPSLLIATVPPKHLFLLVEGIISQRQDRQRRFIQNSLLLIFDQMEEREVRVLAAMLLTPTEEDEQTEDPSFHSRWLAQINNCITDDPHGTFHVAPALSQVIKTIIREGILEANTHRASLLSSKRVALAKNSSQRRKELADLLYEVPLPLKRSQLWTPFHRTTHLWVSHLWLPLQRGMDHLWTPFRCTKHLWTSYLWRPFQQKVIPLVVVTGYEAPNTLIRANAWRVLTLLSDHEYWYSPPGFSQTTLRFVILIGFSILIGVTLTLMLLLILKQ